jgi:ABC-2 type transport system permease protein
MKEIISLTRLFINESLGISLFFYNQKYNKKEFYKSQLCIKVTLNTF